MAINEEMRKIVKIKYSLPPDNYQDCVFERNLQL